MANIKQKPYGHHPHSELPCSPSLRGNTPATPSKLRDATFTNEKIPAKKTV
jgi:hypothetical protein